MADALHHKLRSHDIWLQTGGDIEHHLGVIAGKTDIIAWAPFRKRLKEEFCQQVVADIATIETFAAWLAPTTGTGP